MKRYIGIGMLVFACATAQAEQLYIIDKLVVGVYPQAENEEGKLANLETGDAVEELERVDKHVRVRLSDGTEGWVKANYLTAQPPAIVRLKELQASGAASAAPSPQLTQELTQLKEQNAALLKETEALKQAAANRPIETAPAPTQVQSLAAPATEVSRDQFYGEPETSLPLWMWLAAILATGGVGFLLGYQSFARRLRNKYGSVKII
jgi:SH3 domain protein